MDQAIDVRKRVFMTADQLKALLSITQDADVAGTWLEEPDALYIATIERVTTKRSDDLIGWVHLRSSFSLNEGPRQEDALLARKWLQRNAASKAIYILINNVASSSRPRNSTGVAGGNNQNRRALVFAFDLSGEFTPCVESIDNGEAFAVEFTAVAIENESEEKAEIPPSPKSSDSRSPTTLPRTSLSSVMTTPSPLTAGARSNHSCTTTSSRPKDSIYKTPPPPPPPKPQLPLTKDRSAQSFLASPVSSPTAASPIAAISTGFEPKFIRFGYLRKPDKMGFWVARMVVLDSRQRSLIYASFDRFGALLAPEHIYYSQITRVQLSVYSSRQFEVDVHATPVDLRLGSTVSNQMETHRFLCDDEEDALEWIALLHKASPRLAQHAPPPPKPQKPAASSALFRSASSNPPTPATTPTPVIEKGHNAASRLNPAKVKAEPPTSRTALKRLHAAPPPPSSPVKTPSSATTKTITSNDSSTTKIPPPPPPPPPLQFALQSTQVPSSGGVDSRTRLLQKKTPPPPPPAILSSASLPPAAFLSPAPQASAGQWSPLAKKIPPPPPPPLVSSTSQKTPPPPPPPLVSSASHRTPPPLPSGSSSVPITSKKIPPPPPPPLSSSSADPITSKKIPPPPPPLSSAVVSSIKRRIPPAPPVPLSSSPLQPPAQKKIPPVTLSSTMVKTIHPPPPHSQPVRSSSLTTPAQKIIWPPPPPPLKPQPKASPQSNSQRSPRPRTTTSVSSSLIVERNYRVLSEIYSSDRQSHVSGSSLAAPGDEEVPVWMMPRSSRPRQAPAPPPRRTSPGYYNNLNTIT